MIRVAIADDSPFTCRLLASYLESSGDCSVVGVAHDARSTLELVRHQKPDVLTLDLQMPGSDGVDLLRQLPVDPPVSVVVISGVTRLAAATTLRALELGAVDFVLKYTPGAPVSRASLRREIVAKVKIAATAQPASRPTAGALASAPVAPGPRAARPSSSRAAEPPDPSGIVIIGASTGGPRVIGDVLSQLPEDFGMSCVVVQHLPATFTVPFTMQLGRRARLGVQIAQTGDRVSPGRVLVAPGSLHLVIRPDGRIRLQTPSERDVYRPSINLAMISAAEGYGASAVGVVLTGFGDDGSEGLKRIREAGGEGIVQDVASSVVPDMPSRALERAGADHVAAPERIGQLLALRKKS